MSDVLERVFERLQEKVNETGKYCSPLGYLASHIAGNHEPYKDAVMAMKFLYCASFGLILNCPKCNRRIAFDFYAKERSPLAKESVFAEDYDCALEKCYCEKVLKVERLFNGRNLGVEL